MIYQKEKIYRSTDHKPKKSLTFSGIFDFLIIFGVIVLVGYFLFFSQVFTINRVKISGLENIDKNSLKKQVETSSLDKNIFLFSSQKLKLEILKKYPEIKSLYINKDLPSILTLTIQERFLAFCWSWEGKFYSVDNSGIVYEQTSEPNDPILEIQKQNSVAEEPQIGNQYFEKREIEFIQKLNKKFAKETGLEIQKFIFIEEAYEIQVITEKFMVIFNTARDFEKQFNALKLTLPKVEGEITQYIDLRVPGKLFYK